MSATLIELMSRDPHDCSKQDIEEIVKYYREKRKQFSLGDMKAGKTKAPTAKEAESLAATKSLSIGDML